MSRFSIGDWVIAISGDWDDDRKPVYEVTGHVDAKYKVKCVDAKASNAAYVGMETSTYGASVKLAPEQKKKKSRVPEGLEDMDVNFALSVLKNILNDAAMDLSDWLDVNEPEGVDFLRKNAQIKSLKEAIRLIEKASQV